LIIENLPPAQINNTSRDNEIRQGLYNLLYMFHVEFMLLKKSPAPSGKNITDTLCSIILSTREQADMVVDTYDNYLWAAHGVRLLVSYAKPPMRILGGFSWGGGLPGTHYSNRDQGSMVGTNYEKVFQ
jgi:hypothetical protein